MTYHAHMDIVDRYQNYLTQEYEMRQRRNPGYSLRAFARDIELQPSKLSEILRGKVGLSAKAAHRIAQHLNLTTTEASQFIAMVEKTHGRSAAARAKATRELEVLREAQSYTALDVQKFQVISDWHYNALLELTEVDGFKSNPTWIADRLGISTEKVEQAIELLTKLQLLRVTKSGKIKQTLSHFATSSEIPSRAIREHHQQILMKAEKALTDTPISKRNFSSLTIAVPSDRIELAAEKIQNFRRSLAKELQFDSKSDRVFCLSIQFFPLDQIPGDRK